MKPPQFWYGEPASLMDHLTAFASRALSPIYAAMGARRIAKAQPAFAEPAVICVGNLTLGGTGKTPVTIAILKEALSRDINAQALSRGYGGKLAGPVCVDTTRHFARDVGDEPLLIASAAPVWVSRDRVGGAHAAQLHEADLIIMDDGHQNPDLHKDVSVVVIDAAAGWGNGRVFPAGPLREPVDRGLQRADAVVLMVPEPDFEPDYAGLGLADIQIPVLRAWLKPTAPAPDGPVVAFAGIGRPEKFFNALTAAGARLAETYSFPDHHEFTRAELDQLRQEAARHSASLVTTEKDFVRIPATGRDGVLAWPVRAVFAEPARLTALVQQALDAAAERR
ncbi:tetraacyldisaccharide 4'-kinase [Hyphobacterium sp. HN65]|uniref:Tetraacyldisaccharide 4'-kinase n=1 Tax=Hyphobacterium lacteum TaxID=3116575 RepID=A0ABU7LN54_9PROT|nr:tetraacyldisaccharide 4'-kinase [Hyphobacterium sp. HN65]MEE2525350.1 tetraacyldisaccharide 4'-kinase [Hyphobacterium sp. HN65]